jgi:hypothetical protein
MKKTDASNHVYIISTMSGDVSYCFWNTIGGVPRIKDKITIRGGAGLPSVRSGFGEMSADGEGTPMWTASGIVTPLRADRYELLKDHEVFKKHVAKGLISISNRDITDNHKAVKKAVEGMEAHDGFAQLTPKNYKSKVSITTEKARDLRGIEGFMN